MTKAMPLTLFSWGYWGFGTSTAQLVEAVDAVEKGRGYTPPFFADIRLQRSGKAPEFVGARFENMLGENRYKHFGDLGNQAIRDGGYQRIKNPAAAKTLFDQAIGCARKKQRVIFFCACEFPLVNPCHRVKVGELVVKEARKRGEKVQIVEWPGGEPKLGGVEIQVPHKVYKALQGNRKSIPLGESFSLAEMAGLPWGSVATVHSDRQDSNSPLSLMVGPAKYKRDQWYLPVLEHIDEALSPAKIQRKVHTWLQEEGYDAHTA